MKRKYPWNKGIKLSEKIIENMKKNRVGMKGKHHSEETKQKIRLINKEKHYSLNTEFKKGSNGFRGKHTKETINKIIEKTKGKHWSPHNEFKKYDYGKIKSKKKNGKSVLLNHISWCKSNQIHRVPFNREKDGCMIHHIDGNRENNNPENLQLMTRDFHIKLHRTLLQ